MKIVLITEQQIKTLYEYLLNQPLNTGNIELCELLMSLRQQKPHGYEVVANLGGGDLMHVAYCEELEEAEEIKNRKSNYLIQPLFLAEKLE